MEHRTPEEVDELISRYSEKISEIKEKVPGIVLDILNSRRNIQLCFDSDGNPKGDYRVSPTSRKRIVRIMSTSHLQNGKMVYGRQDKGFVISIKTNPEFLSDEDLTRLSRGSSIKKIVGGYEVEMILSEFRGPIGVRPKDIVDSYKRSMKRLYPGQKAKLDEYAKLVAYLRTLRERLNEQTPAQTSRIVKIDSYDKRK